MGIDELIRKVARQVSSTHQATDASQIGAAHGLLFEQAALKDQIVSLRLAALPALFNAAETNVLPPSDAEGLLRQVLLALPSAYQTEAVSALRHRLDAEQPQSTRTMAMRLFAACYPEAPSALFSLTELACGSDHPREIRFAALAALAVMRIDPDSAERLAQVLNSPDDEIVLGCLRAVARLSRPMVESGLHKRLRQLILERTTRIRLAAIEALGQCGAIDDIDYVCMSPSMDADTVQAIQKMTAVIVTRPRDVLRLRPEHFEHLVKRLLQRMGFEEVELTGQPHDGGIDLRAWKAVESFGGGRPRRVHLVQCKRHRDPISNTDLMVFAEVLNREPQAHGLFIATTTFASDAQSRIGNQKIELINRARLQECLDEYLGHGSYQIGTGDFT